MKTIWRTLSSVNGVTMSVGMIPVRKSSQVPAFSGALAAAVRQGDAGPGLMSRPRPMPTMTAISAVDRNQNSVLRGQPRRAVDIAEVGDDDCHRGEDQRRHCQLQQLDEDFTDFGEGGGQPGDVPVAGGEAESHAEDEAQQDLRPEGDLGYARAGRGRGGIGREGGPGLRSRGGRRGRRGRRGHGQTPEASESGLSGGGEGRMSRAGDRRSRRRAVRPRVQRQVADMQRQRSTCSRSTSATPGRPGRASGEVTAEIMAVTLTLRV